MSRRNSAQVLITIIICYALVSYFPQYREVLGNPENLLGNPGFENGIVPVGMAWTKPFDPVDPSGGVYTSLALDPYDNTPHISYYDDDYGDLKYATLRSGEWIIETIDSVGDVGLYTSLALESRGALNPNIHISYYDRTNGDLKYAFLSGTTGTWDIQILDGDTSSLGNGGTLGDVGLYTSITLDILNNPYISYYAQHAEELRLAYTGEGPYPSSWWVESGPNAQIGGESTSIALDPLFINPIIAYFDLNSQSLKLAMYDRADAFSYPIIDNPYPDWGVELVGYGTSIEDISLALDSGGEPHIIYSDVGYTFPGGSLKRMSGNGLYNAANCDSTNRRGHMEL